MNMSLSGAIHKVLALATVVCGCGIEWAQEQAARSQTQPTVSSTQLTSERRVDADTSSTSAADSLATTTTSNSAADTEATVPTSKPWTLHAERSHVRLAVLKATGAHDVSFHVVRGKLWLDKPSLDKAQPVRLEVEVETGALTADVEAFANHLKSSDFLDARRYPVARFHSTSMVAENPKRHEYRVNGDMELHGRKVPISFVAVVKTEGKDYVGTANVRLAARDYDLAAAKVANELIDQIELQLKLRFHPPT